MKWALSLILLLTATACQNATLTTLEDLARKKRLSGIDVSHFQGDINWPEVAQGPVDFAIIKCTDFTRSVDPRFHDNWRGAKEAGLPRGAYHFFHPTYSVQEQVEYFVKELKDDPGELPPVVDVETYKKEYGRYSCAELERKVEDFLKGVEKALHRRPMIYTNYLTWEQSFCGSSRLDGTPLWLAEYNPAIQSPQLPKGWTQWAVWQYSESGSVPGIAGAVDRDRLNPQWSQR